MSRSIVLVLLIVLAMPPLWGCTGNRQQAAASAQERAERARAQQQETGREVLREMDRQQR